MGWKEPKSNYVASDEVTPEIFNELAENEKYLKTTQDTKITSAQVKDAVINNTIFSTRANLTASEVLSTGFAKVRRWLSDLKGLAFKDVVTEADISGTIAGTKISGAVALADKTTKMETARSIGLSGVTATAQSFDGTTDITIPITTVPATLLTGTGNISITGNAGSATRLQTARVIGLSGVTAQAVSFDGSENVTIIITGVPPTLLTSGTASISITGNAGSANQLATSRSIGLSGVTATARSFNGTANITIPITAVPATLLTGTIASARLPIAGSGIGGVKNGGNVTVNSDGTLSSKGGSGSTTTVTARAGLGNYTNLDSVLNYISNVFLGLQKVTKIKAQTFDAED